MISHDQARQLLEKYFAGDTSLAEEQDLRRYYAEVTDYPSDLAAYADLFRYFSAEAKVATSSAWEQSVAQPPQARRRSIKRWWAVAATVALLLTATFVWWQQPNTYLASAEDTIDWSKYEVQDPDEAFRITRKALLQTSVALNQSTQMATEEVRQIHKILPNLK